MKIEYITGDLMQAPEGIILHGCNAQGVMGSGVAKLIRDKYPEAYAAYRTAFVKRWMTLGSVVFVQSGDKMIGNAITQEFYGREPGRVYADYEGIQRAFEFINRRAPMYVGDGGRVAMPMIGAGLAGGDWSIIANIIEWTSQNYQPVVYQLAPA